MATTNGIPRPPVWRWFVVQIIVLLIVALLFALKSQVAIYSAFVGGVIFLVPHGYFAIKAFRYTGARSAKKIMTAFYQGEAGKLILCAILFTVAFKWIQPLDIAALFLTFATMLVSNWLTPLLMSGSTQRS